MKTIAIIAEFNPFHNGHLHLIEACKKELNADNCIVIMSGDFVQRGAPAILDKFTRAKMALSCGADIVIELPVYYSTGSAEYFAMGAVSLISKIGIVDYLCFGSECGNIDELKGAAKILYNESAEYKEELSILLQNGKNYPSARAMAVEKVSGFDTAVLSSPNNVLGIEYIRAINALGSSVFPHTIKRIGEDYNSSKMTELAGASAIRAGLLNQESEKSLCISMPPACFDMIKKYKGKLATSNDLSHLLRYKLLLEKQSGFDKYLDISEDISNRIVSYIDNFKGYDDFCSLIKTKNIT